MNSAEAINLHSEEASAHRWTPENCVLIAFSAAVLLIVVLAGLAGHALSSSVATQAWVEHTYTVLNTLHRASANLSAVGTDVQAYVITGDERYLAQRERSASAVISNTLDLKGLTADNRLETQRAAELDRAMRAMIDQMTMVLVRRQTDGFAAAQALYARGVNRALTATIAKLQHAMVSEETQLLAQRKRDEANGRHRLALVIGALAVVVIATIMIGFELLRREIKTRRRLATSHAAQEQFLETVLNQIPLLVWVKDLESRIVTVNRAMEQWMGRPREEMIGRKTGELFSPEDAVASIALDRRALTTDDVVIDAADVRTTRTGTRVTLFTRKIAVRNTAGTPLCILCIAEDVSEKLADERHIRELNASLERHKSELEATNRELESFSYSVSHDLRVPLRAIDGFSQMLLEDYGPQLDAEAQRYLTTIRAATRRMGQLIDDLLAFARTGRQALNAASVDMTELARQAAADALRDIQGPAPRLIVDSLPAACGDGSLLKQVWVNLIGNAVKYSSKVATPVIDVKARTEGDEVIYSVADNGAGFDMQFAHKLFKVFQRLHGQEEFSGTGVGLAIVHRIVTRHGGRVWAEGAPGRGATFYFTVAGALSA